MCTPPAAEEDRVAKIRLFIIFTEAIPRSSFLSPEDRYPLLSALLHAVQKVRPVLLMCGLGLDCQRDERLTAILASLPPALQSIAADAVANQALFRHAGMICKAVDLLDGPLLPFPEVENLLEDVLRTIRVLVANSKASRTTLEEKVMGQHTPFSPPIPMKRGLRLSGDHAPWVPGWLQ